MGEKIGEVAEKVATDTAEDLRKEAAKHKGEFPGRPHPSYIIIIMSSSFLRIGMAS